MKTQLNLFLTALMFYTRIPVPKTLEYSPERLNRSTRYLPLIGWIVGGVGAAVFYGLVQIFPVSLSVFLSMLATILLTGSFHEDGFADFCDGFGGGYTREKIFTIMKDSRIGTYGSVGLIGMLGTKFLSLQSLPVYVIPLTMVAAHGFSRLMPVMIIFTSRYSREDELSKSKPIGKRGKQSDLFLAILFALVPTAFLPWQMMAVVLPLGLLLTFGFKKYIERKIDGYTGDCLGALQQMVEVLFYLCLLAIS
ncbi:adenosylcobinamide-GDP ribazoletransferase [Mangrovibacterium diazotrophicum]|uniref:Adenosylcobinamide-GDP ribazoletransferase n=1 Tax=Mangrovibacterium diazotrophicum TaxID=1261403 RepID=A0A419WA66_9BACT|nr:adenosylcobinamide-GDP ribazoletransferase [Mangrovibacterium diazotrophicum]RKD92314.1 cobalamin-5'-phosphate synthase [Mangrovibacterium diazotrophicum]